jgi:putative Holliday junction resolvase
MGRVLAVDPGDVRIGLAISDPLGVVARPLKVLRHVGREKDAQAILEEAGRQGAQLIVVGVALDEAGGAGPQARKALRLVEALRSLGSIPVETWDESGSSARAARLGRGRHPLDAMAAAVILQEYLDARDH